MDSQPNSTQVFLKAPEEVSAIQRCRADLLRWGLVKLGAVAIAPSDAPPASPTANSDVSFVYSEDPFVSSSSHNTTVGSDDGREYSKDRKQVVLASFSFAPLSGPDVAPYTSRPRASPSTVGHGVAMRKAETSGTFTDALQGPYLYVIDLVARTADENMFKLVPDTATNISWLLGEDPDIHYSADGSQTTANTQAFERSFPNLNPSHAYLPGHVENYPDDQGNVNREEGVYAKRVVYSDETVAWVTLCTMSDPIAYRLPWSRQYWSDGTSTTGIQSTYRFAIAYAVTRALFHRPYDGVLALGLSDRQDIDPDLTSESAPSILTSLADNVLRRTQELQVYIVLRSNGKHWIAFNGWPLPEGVVPMWTSPIRVDSSEHWALRLTGFSIKQKTVAAGIPCVILVKAYDFKGKSKKILLDTGSSVSWVEPGIIHWLRTKVFESEDNLRVDRERGDNGSLEAEIPEYTVPKDFSHSHFVNLTFEGQGGQPVSIQIALDRFLYRRRMGGDHEGLLFTMPENMLPTEGKDTYIFGVNFFEAALVALHKPRQGEPYVRLANPKTEVAPLPEL